MRVSAAFFLCWSIIMPASTYAQTKQNDIPATTHRRSVAFGQNGMVAAAHPLAVTIGLDVLKDGGSAVDAAIAVNAALGVVEPMSCGIGGDLFAIVWDAKTQKLYGLNASGPAPASMTIDKITPEPDGTIALRSPQSWTVPGCVDGWTSLHERFGKLPLARLMQPSIDAARNGAIVPRVIAGYWQNGTKLKELPGFAETFMPNGTPPLEGALFKNPALAETYQRIAQHGRDGFYNGVTAKQIAAQARQHGGFITTEDLAVFRSEWIEPISTTYRGVKLYELPPNGQGLAAIQMLNILENFDLKKLGRASPEYWHVLIEAKKLAFADRARYYADPKFADVPIAQLGSKSYAKQRAALIDMNKAAQQDPPGDPRIEHGDTTYLCTADADGNMVSLIQSNYYGFGSGYVVGGFAMQNRGALFNLDPKHPNALKPGKRPFHTIIPAFAMRDGKPWLAFGVMGGSMQPQGHAQVLINLLDFEMDLQQAGDAARFRHLGSSQPTGTTMTDGGTVHVEAALPASIRQALEAKGHRIVIEDASFGGYQAIMRDPQTGHYAGATESRKDGMALGY